jgi:nitrate/nitrite transport system substrate-binding protein
MVFTLRSQSALQWNNLACDTGRDTGRLADFNLRCNVCGEIHLSQDHWQFMETMPSDPVDLIDDLIKMRVYKPDALALADSISQAELRKTLFLKMAAQGSAKREQLCLDLIKLAGGLDQAFAAAFGPKAGLFFNDAMRTSQVTRREFLRNVAIGAALVSLTNCSPRPDSAQTAAGDAAAPAPADLEKTDLQIGFIPITCATPIIMSEPLGFYERYGLNAKVVKMPNWAAVRDSAIAGELDAYHMLAPMPIAMTLGLGSTSFPIKLASIENINGQAITVASKYRDQVTGPADFRGFTIGVPFPYSMHNLLIRYYLASGGLDPDQDVKIEPVPPPDSVAKLTVGDIDAMLMPDPFNQRAVYEGVGFIHMLTKDLWAGHPCCAFAASDQWIEANPNTFRALNKAIIDSANYASSAENRREIATAISERQFLNQPPEVVEAVLTGNFDDGLGNAQEVPDRIDFDPYPWKSFASWISSQLTRWELLPEEQANYAEIGEQVFLTDLARELAEELGQQPPSEETRVEKLKFDTFDPADPAAYVKEQVDKFGA